jgi:predicted nucleic acid-binding protein
MNIVVNSTPLIELSKIRRLTLLRDVYSKIIIPEEVHSEVVIQGVGQPGAAEVRTATWIEVRAVTNPNSVMNLHVNTQLGLGECGVIVLAEEIHAQRVIIDDKAARQIAQARGLPVIGTVGVLIVAKTRGIIPNVRDILDVLRTHGMRISPRLYQQILTAAGE